MCTHTATWFNLIPTKAHHLARSKPYCSQQSPWELGRSFGLLPGPAISVKQHMSSAPNEIYLCLNVAIHVVLNFKRVYHKQVTLQRMRTGWLKILSPFSSTTGSTRLLAKAMMSKQRCSLLRSTKWLGQDKMKLACGFLKGLMWSTSLATSLKATAGMGGGTSKRSWSEQPHWSKGWDRPSTSPQEDIVLVNLWSCKPMLPKIFEPTSVDGWTSQGFNTYIKSIVEN